MKINSKQTQQLISEPQNAQFKSLHKLGRRPVQWNILKVGFKKILQDSCLLL